MNELKITSSIFESIKHIDENGVEYWYARELMVALGYKKWQKFINVINDAKTSCFNSNNIVSDHFTQVGKMVNIGSNTKRRIIDYELSRYACYLIAQNGDSRKETIALAQTYFAIQTRKQKLRKENIQGEDKANKTHYKVGKKVRQTIKDLGGTMPEELPTPKKSLKELEKEKNKKLK